MGRHLRRWGFVFTAVHLPVSNGHSHGVAHGRGARMSCSSESSNRTAKPGQASRHPQRPTTSNSIFAYARDEDTKDAREPRPPRHHRLDLQARRYLSSSVPCTAPQGKRRGPPLIGTERRCRLAPGEADKNGPEYVVAHGPDVVEKGDTDLDPGSCKGQQLRSAPPPPESLTKS